MRLRTNRTYRTSELARLAGVHPNTVRRYVEWGLLPAVERSPSGYRRFTRRHLDCLLLVRLVYGSPYAGKAIRGSERDIIASAVADDWGGALELAYRHLALVQSERAHANSAAVLLERWAQGIPTESAGAALRIGQAAQRLGVTVDIVRNWERNGLVSAPRDPKNGYRQFGGAEIGRMRVIRMLSRAGYSLMAILRMMSRLDQGGVTGLREILDTPRPDEDVYLASDRWISTLENQETLARRIIEWIEDVIQRGPDGDLLAPVR
jgi:DNA-binding transcriptional MerR regulator